MWRVSVTCRTMSRRSAPRTDTYERCDGAVASLTANGTRASHQAWWWSPSSTPQMSRASPHWQRNRATQRAKETLRCRAAFGLRKVTSHSEQLALARELVDDLELSRLGPEQSLLKAARLARLVEDSATEAWLRWEISGYPNTGEARIVMVRFGRLTTQDASVGYWQPLAGVVGAMRSMELEIQSLRVPDVNFSPTSANPNEFVTGFAGAHLQSATKPVADILSRQQILSTAITNLSGLRSKVIGAVHEFAVSHFHRLAFGTLAENIFVSYRDTVDSLLAQSAPEAIQKIPALYSRLAEGDSEAVSQAMNTLRRLIKATADRLQPASDVPIQIDGVPYEIGADKVLNRIAAYVSGRTSSKSRRSRLRRGLQDIWERASASAHGDISSMEARSLFLQSYLLLGEVLTLNEEPTAA